MSIENQIAVNADEPEQQTAKDILELMASTLTYVRVAPRVGYDLDEITGMIADNDLREAAYQSVTGDPESIKELYIKTIQSLME